MKPAFVIIALGSAALSACAAAKNSVEVDVTDARGATGSVLLCDRETPLSLQGARLKAHVPVTCEGVGEVRLHLGQSGSTTCRIGYVSPGVEQSFLFALRDGECVAIAESSSSAG